MKPIRSRMMVLLLVPALLVLGLVAGVAWVGYKERQPEKMDFTQVRELLVGSTPTVIHRVAGWGSKRHGFDDGEDWIEFHTDSAGLKALITSRAFSLIPQDHGINLRRMSSDPDSWQGPHDSYEDDSEFDQHGTSYHLMTRVDGDGILAIIARSQQ